MTSADSPVTIVSKCWSCDAEYRRVVSYRWAKSRQMWKQFRCDRCGVSWSAPPADCTVEPR